MNIYSNTNMITLPLPMLVYSNLYALIASLEYK